MMKKKYIAPRTIEFEFSQSSPILMASRFSGDGDHQDVERDDEPYNGEINARRRSVWDDEEDNEY